MTPIDELRALLLEILDQCDPAELSDTAESLPPPKPLDRPSETRRGGSERTRRRAASR